MLTCCKEPKSKLLSFFPDFKFPVLITKVCLFTISVHSFFLPPGNHSQENLVCTLKWFPYKRQKECTLIVRKNAYHLSRHKSNCHRDCFEHLITLLKATKIDYNN